VVLDVVLLATDSKKLVKGLGVLVDDLGKSGILLADLVEERLDEGWVLLHSLADTLDLGRVGYSVHRVVVQTPGTGTGTSASGPGGDTTVAVHGSLSSLSSACNGKG
jgi:hypothetical protein